MLQVYNEKSKERGFVLRPEGTSSVVRAVLESNSQNDILNKYYYIGPMFRSERPQKGRYRQFYQLGIENMNCEGLWGDFEVIKVGDEIMQEVMGSRDYYKVSFQELFL